MPASTKPVITQNFNVALPADDSHNAPWGVGDKALADAISTFDAAIVAGVQSSQWAYAADTGAANAYAAAFTPAPALVAGLSLFFKAAHANTGASTLAVNGGSAKAITKSGTTALAGAEISANQIVHVMYDGTQFQLISQ
jgi:hypothetical protein